MSVGRFQLPGRPGSEPIPVEREEVLVKCGFVDRFRSLVGVGWRMGEVC